VGVYENDTYYGALQINLSSIPVGSRIEEAALELAGLSSEQLASGGIWTLRLLDSEIDQDWTKARYDQIRDAPVLDTISPELTSQDLEARQRSIFNFAPAQLTELERRLETGLVSFRLDGPVQGVNNLFTWDTGYGGGFGDRPVLRLAYQSPPTPTPIVVAGILSTPTPANAVTAAALAATATYEATVFGTPTPTPRNVWTATPPIVVTNTPVPGNAATAEWMVALTTAEALVYGTPTPLPTNVWTATPSPTHAIVTPTPTPGNILTVVALASTATQVAATTGTYTPVPESWVMPIIVTPTPTPANRATAIHLDAVATAEILAFGTPTPTPMNVWTATPSPTYAIVTSTPTPENVFTAVAVASIATQVAGTTGTFTPVPGNWVTPIIVTPTPTPINRATALYQDTIATAGAVAYGTATPTPINVWTATPTPVFVLLQGEIPTPASTPTPTAAPQPIPPELVGKIAFLSDRAYHTDADTQRRNGQLALPLGDPLVYVVNPDGSGLALLSDRWPYDLAVKRDTYSADQRFRVFVKDALVDTGTKVGGTTLPIQLRVPSLFFFDFYYNVEEQITYFGADDGHSPIAYEPAWSPAAEQIAFVSNNSGNDEIWIINRDGSGARQLTVDRNGLWDKHPSWSPDGSKIVFWSNRTGNRQIWVMNADGSDFHSLSRTGFNDWDPVWIKYTEPPLALP
jgi:hypothetical protein